MASAPTQAARPTLPRIAVVSADNRFVRWADRREIHAHQLPHRSIQVLLTSAAGELLLQRRHADKLTFPGHWDVSCAGHVDETDYTDPLQPDLDLDRIYEAVARREIEEELGVRTTVDLLGHFGPEPGIHYEHLHLYRARHDGPFVCQPDEVSEVRFVDLHAWSALLDDARAGRAKICPALVWFVDWARTNAGLFAAPVG